MEGSYGAALQLSDHCWCWRCTFHIKSTFAPKAGHSLRTDGGWAEHGVLKQLRVSPACIAVPFGLMGISIWSLIPTFRQLQYSDRAIWSHNQWADNSLKVHLINSCFFSDNYSCYSDTVSPIFYRYHCVCILWYMLGGFCVQQLLVLLSPGRVSGVSNK